MDTQKLSELIAQSSLAGCREIITDLNKKFHLTIKLFYWLNICMFVLSEQSRKCTHSALFLPKIAFILGIHKSDEYSQTPPGGWLINSSYSIIYFAQTTPYLNFPQRYFLLVLGSFYHANLSLNFSD